MAEPTRDGKKLYYAYIEEIVYDTKWFYASNDEEAEDLMNYFYDAGKIKPHLLECVNCCEYGVEPDPKYTDERHILEYEE